MGKAISHTEGINNMENDLISRQAAIELIERMKPYHQEADDIAEMIANMPSAQPERKWIPCSNPPKHHRDVLVRGIEAIGNVNVYKVMQWDVDTWRPMDYAPSIIWKEWSEI